MLKISIENLKNYPSAAFAVIEEIRPPRIAFHLEKADGEDIKVGGAFVGTLDEPELPITEEKLISAIEGAFASPVDEPSEPEGPE